MTSGLQSLGCVTSSKFLGGSSRSVPRSPLLAVPGAESFSTRRKQSTHIIPFLPAGCIIRLLSITLKYFRCSVHISKQSSQPFKNRLVLLIPLPSFFFLTLSESHAAYVLNGFQHQINMSQLKGGNISLSSLKPAISST